MSTSLPPGRAVFATVVWSCLACGAAEPAAAQSVDWPQWRGPNRDGIAVGVAVPTAWPPTLREEWRSELGEGVASPVVVGGYVYVFTRQNEDEIVHCLDLASGKERWRTEPCPAPYEWQAGEGNFSKGPRSTPVVARGHVFTFGVSGVLSCLEAETGKPVWRQDCSPVPPYASNSPLVADGLCVVHYGDVHKRGGLTAFDAATGELKWRYADGSGPMCSSPIVVDLADERQVVGATGWDFLGLSLHSGKKLWNLKASFGLGTRCITPLKHKNLLLLADYQEAPFAVRLEKVDSGLTAKEVWRAEGLKLYYTSPVLAEGLLFGMSTTQQGCFFCLDPDTGKTLWQSNGRQGENASILSAGSVLLILVSDGRLLVVKPTAAAYEPIAEYRVSDSKTYAHPVFLGDRILIKDDRTLRSFAIEGGRR
jgi:outer membrane protein assembly factor BamB